MFIFKELRLKQTQFNNCHPNRAGIVGCPCRAIISLDGNLCKQRMLSQLSLIRWTGITKTTVPSDVFYFLQSSATSTTF